MDITITINKSEFESKLIQASELQSLSKKVTSNEEAIAFVPMSGKIIEFLHLLRDNQIAYKTNGEGSSS